MRGTFAKAPTLELVERCWTLRAVASGRESVCSIFQTDIGLEVRAGFRDDILHSKRAIDLPDARAIANEFKRTLIDVASGIDARPLTGD